MDSPFHQLHSDEVVPISRVENDEAVWRRGLELEEEVHGGVGLQRGQTQVAALGLEGHRVSDDGSDAEASVQLTVINVSILTQVNVEHAVKPEDSHKRRAGVVVTTALLQPLNVVVTDASIVRYQSSYSVWLTSTLTRLSLTLTSDSGGVR